MAMANMNLIGVFVTQLWPVQALACGGGDVMYVTNTPQFTLIHIKTNQRQMFRIPEFSSSPGLYR